MVGFVETKSTIPLLVEVVLVEVLHEVVNFPPHSEEH
jgi:hypothetical protein